MKDLIRALRYDDELCGVRRHLGKARVLQKVCVVMVVALSNLPMLLYNKYMYAKFMLSLVYLVQVHTPLYYRLNMSFMPEIA